MINCPHSSPSVTVEVSGKPFTPSYAPAPRRTVGKCHRQLSLVVSGKPFQTLASATWKIRQVSSVIINSLTNLFDHILHESCMAKFQQLTIGCRRMVVEGGKVSMVMPCYYYSITSTSHAQIHVRPSILRAGLVYWPIYTIGPIIYYRSMVWSDGRALGC